MHFFLNLFIISYKYIQVTEQTLCTVYCAVYNSELKTFCSVLYRECFSIMFAKIFATHMKGLQSCPVLANYLALLLSHSAENWKNYCWMSVCMYVRVYASMYACMYVFMYVCMHVCMYLCMYVFMYLCMYVCMYVCIYISTYIMEVH